MFAGLLYAFPPVEVHNPARTDSPYMWNYENLLMADGVSSSVTLSGTTAKDSTMYYWWYPTTAIAFTAAGDSIAFWIYAEICHIATGATAAVPVVKIDSLYVSSTGRKTWRPFSTKFDENIRFRFTGTTCNGKDLTVLSDMRLNRAFGMNPAVNPADSLIFKYRNLTQRDTVSVYPDSLLTKYIRRTNRDTVTVQQDLTTRRSVGPLDTLTTPGYFPWVNTAGYTHATIVFWDSLATTSATVQFQGFSDNLAPLGPYNLDADNDSTVYVGANGTWARTFTLAGGIDKIRQRVLSEAGGVAALFKSVIILWNNYK